MAWYTDFQTAARDYTGKTAIVVGLAAAIGVASFYTGKWQALREPVVESVTLTPDLDGDGRPDVGVLLSNKRYEAAFMQEGRTFLTHKGMLGKYKKLEEKFGIPRQSERSNLPTQLNPLDQPFNYRFTPEQPAQLPTGTAPAAGAPANTQSPANTTTPPSYTAPPASTQPPQPLMPSPSGPAGPAVTPSGSNYDSRAPSPNRTAYVGTKSDLENRAEVEFNPAGNHVSPLVPVSMPSRRQ